MRNKLKREKAITKIINLYMYVISGSPSLDGDILLQSLLSLFFFFCEESEIHSIPTKGLRTMKMRSVFSVSTSVVLPGGLGELRI